MPSHGVRAAVCALVFTALAGCATFSATVNMDKATAKRLISALPKGIEKDISLAILRNPTTKFRIDTHGYPTWTWLGPDDIGACIHIAPKTRKPFLETQFASADRGSVPKYIDFDTDGKAWMCRIHIQEMGFDYENNWSGPNCVKDARKLNAQLAAALGVRHVN